MAKKESALILGVNALHQHRLNDAKGHFLKARNNAVDNPAATAESTQLLSQVLYKQGKFREAAHECALARRIYEKLGDEVRIGRCLHMCGMLEFAHGNEKAALSEYDKAMAIAKKYKNKQEVARLLHQTGVALESLGSKNEAKKSFVHSLAIAREFEDLEQISASLYHLAIIEADEGNKEKALAHFEESLAIRLQYRSYIGKDSVILFNIAMLATELGHLDSALRAMIEFLDLPKDHETKHGKKIELGIEFVRGKMGRDHFVKVWRSITGVNPPSKHFSHPKEIWERSRELTECGDDHLTANELSKALTCYERAIEPLYELKELFEKRNETLRFSLVNSDLASILSRLAWVLREINEPREAMNDWIKIVEYLEYAVAHLPTVKPRLQEARKLLQAHDELSVQKEALDLHAAKTHPAAWRAAQLIVEQLGNLNKKDREEVFLSACWNSLFPGQLHDPDDPDYPCKKTRFEEFMQTHQNSVAEAVEPLAQYDLKKLKLGNDSLNAIWADDEH